MLYTAVPAGWFTSNFNLTGHGHTASLEFNWIGEQGKAVVDGIECQISKEGLINAVWSLNVEGQKIATARKPSMFTSQFEIEGPTGLMILQRGHAFGRLFLLKQGTELIATIKPAGWFTRTLNLEVYNTELEFPVLTLVVWLRLLLIRRDQKHNS